MTARKYFNISRVQNEKIILCLPRTSVFESCPMRSDETVRLAAGSALLSNRTSTILSVTRGSLLVDSSSSLIPLFLS